MDGLPDHGPPRRLGLAPRQTAGRDPRRGGSAADGSSPPTAACVGPATMPAVEPDGPLPGPIPPFPGPGKFPLPWPPGGAAFPPPWPLPFKFCSTTLKQGCYTLQFTPTGTPLWGTRFRGTLRVEHVTNGIRTSADLYSHRLLDDIVGGPIVRPIDVLRAASTADDAADTAGTIPIYRRACLPRIPEGDRRPGHSTRHRIGRNRRTCTPARPPSWAAPRSAQSRSAGSRSSTAAPTCRSSPSKVVPLHRRPRWEGRRSRRSSKTRVGSSASPMKASSRYRPHWPASTYSGTGRSWRQSCTP